MINFAHPHYINRTTYRSQGVYALLETDDAVYSTDLPEMFGLDELKCMKKKLICTKRTDVFSFMCMKKQTQHIGLLCTQDAIANSTGLIDCKQSTLLSKKKVQEVCEIKHFCSTAYHAE